MTWLKALHYAPLLILSLAGCATADVEPYQNEKPALNLQHYLNGSLQAWGIFQGRSGEVKKRFHVAIYASWKNDNGIIDEHFSWSDGSHSRRIWKLARQADGTYRGQADDVVGEAIGELSGNTLHWRYVLALPVDGKIYNVNLDDWMYLIDDKVMINRSYMSKWGISLGEISLSFAKQ
jgi:hypothetical protein